MQYFVYIQEAKIPIVHLIHKGGHEFVILNDRMELIDANEFDATFKMEMLEKDINFEDMIVSTLITVSPANIYIHTRDADMTIIKTIRQIFEDRTTVCSYCRTCDIYLGKRQNKINYPLTLNEEPIIIVIEGVNQRQELSARTVQREETRL